MVFESIVADLLNKYLGEYVENLDRSQLQIGIWGGDIVLQNLVLKQSALDELDLPVRTVYGLLEKLVLKIPWKNLYRDPVEATIERLFLLAVPNQEVKYDPVKEERWAQESKQNQLLKVEAAKKWEAEKDLLKQDDSFVEKLSTQIVKNVQVKIGEIHIRYEDRVSSLGRPFALGITLHNLSVQTTDANWTKAVKDEASAFIFKELSLEGLAVYWNCDTVLFSDKSVTEMLQLFKDGIAAKERQPKGYSYMLGPINSSAKLRINPKPEQDGSNYTIPKLQLSLELEKLAVNISKSQYCDVILLLESMDWMMRAAPYRKYRPFVPSYAGHYKEWWKFAYKCILEDEVRRKQRNWDWNIMRQHRTLCKAYADAYRQKLTTKKVPAELTIQLQEMENQLDVFNIVLIRQRIEVQVERDLAEELRQKQQRKGWFSSWWGGNAEADAVQPGSAAELAKKIEAVMTPDEKAKLYRAIDYQENSTPTIYPPHFIENCFSFKLRSLEIEIRDGQEKPQVILNSSLQEVTALVEQRMSGQAVKASIKITKFSVAGLAQGSLVPQLVSSRLLQDPDSVLLDVVFETKPLDESCDQRLRVAARPLRIVYDAATVNCLMDLFKPPETPSLQTKIPSLLEVTKVFPKIIDDILPPLPPPCNEDLESSSSLEILPEVRPEIIIQRIQAAIPVSVPVIKEMSVLGLQYAVEQHHVFDVSMDFMPSQVLIPHNGVYRGDENVLVVSLGRMTITTEAKDTFALDVRKMHLRGESEVKILEAMMSRSYTKFTLKLEDVQVLLAYAGEDWKAVLQERKRSPMHVVMPISVTVGFHKCMVTDDPRLPKMKICAELGHIDFQFPEGRLLHLINLPRSIPFNVPEPTPLSAVENASHSSQLSLLWQSDADAAVRVAAAKGLQLPKLEKPTQSQPLAQMIELEAKFVLERLRVSIFEDKKDTKDQKELDLENPLLTFCLLDLETEYVQRTFDNDLLLSLGGVDMKQSYEGNYIDVIGTPMTSGQDQYLFTVRLTQVDRKSPELHTLHHSVLKLVKANFSTLNVLVHQEAILLLIAFVNNFQSRMDNDFSVENSRSATRKERVLPTIMEEESSVVPVKPKTAKKRKRRSTSSIIDLKVIAELNVVGIRIETKERPLSLFAIQGLVFGAEARRSHTEISAHLKDFVVLDLNPVTIHKKILSIVDEEALSAHVVMYDIAEVNDPDAVDMSVKVQMACLHVIYLNWFVSSLTGFLNNFQAAQAAVYEASAAAAEVAKQNAKEAYTKATRMSLDIELKAPIVVVPVNSKSLDGLLMDFGLLTIKNTFQNLDVKKEYPAVLDKIQLGLMNVKMSRVRLDADTREVLNECILLKPISFTLSVIRNLSSSWYNESPDLDLSGKINSISLSLSEEDYHMLMQVLSENMSEGQVAGPETQQPEPVDSRTTIQTAKASFSNLPCSQVSAAKDVATESTTKKVHVFMVFKFTMDSLVINLYSGGSKTLEESVDERRPEQGLACFTLYVLALKGQMLSDNSLSTSVRLVDCLLDDTRVGREGKITRLMESKALVQAENSLTISSPTSEAAKRTMLDVTVRMKPTDMFVDVRIFSFNLIVSVDYLLKISNFFVGRNEKTKQPAPSKQSNVPHLSGAASRATTSVQEPEKSTQTVMTVNVRLEKPDIILVEAMDDLDTNALVLNCELTFNLRLVEEVMNIAGALEDLQLFTCCFNPSKRSDTKSLVLQPTRINVAGSTKPGQGLHMELISSDIRIAVTPGTLELLNRCQATLTAKHGPDAEDNKGELDFSKIWDQKTFSECEFWFLKTEMAQDAMTALAETSPSTESAEEVVPITPLSELVIVTMPSIVVTVEAGVGNKTMPMMLLETSFQGAIRDFSSLLHIESSLTLQMWYYNSRLALWEPLIEPVESHSGGQVVHVPWELKMEVEFNDVNGSATILDDSTQTNEEVELPPLQPLMNVLISSKENLEITVTKTCLDVISTLGEGFKTAMKDGLPRAGALTGAPYQVRNHTGLAIDLDLAASTFKLANQVQGQAITTVVLESGACVELALKESDTHGRDALSLKSSSGGTVQERILRIGVTEKKASLELPVIRADKRYFSLQKKGDTSPLQWGLVSDVQVEDGGFIVSLRSIIQVHNHFNVAVNVYYMTPRGNELESVGVVEPGKQINLPLKAVYTPTSELFFSVDGYSVSIQPFVWRDLQKTLLMTKLLQCDPKAKEDQEPFFIKAVGEMEQVFYENTSRHTFASTCYNVHLRPAVTLKNFLPWDLACRLQGAPEEKLLKAGERMQIPTAEPGAFTIVLKIPNYLDKEWSCKNPIKANPPEFSVWVFESFDSEEKVSLDLGVHSVQRNGSMAMAIYAPFWMINKTGLMLSYRPSEDLGNVLFHPAFFKGPVLLSYRSKDLHSKKKAALKVEDGEWSTNFPLDVAGSSGLVSCKVDGVTYQVGVHIQLNSNSLTKQVTFTPYYVLVNNAPFAIECREDDRPNDPWLKVEPGACNPFWPKSSSTDAALRVRVSGTMEMSGAFSYNTVYTVLLRLNNKYGGLNVDVQMTEGGVYVSFTAYEPGLAPALIINHTSETMKIWEDGSSYMRKLSPKEMILFAWEKPSGERSLCWSCNKSKVMNDNLRKDGIGEFRSESNEKLYWVSFLDGIQRVLLFTLDPAVARDAQSAGELETPSMAISISIYGLGLSLVNSLCQRELMYIGIASSGVIWETRKVSGSRFKPLSISDGLLMEEAWERYNREIQIGNTPNPRMKIGKYEVDLEREEILSPSKRVLRRSFQTGLWIQRKVSAHQEQLHVKVNRLQIDNQMADCIFPVVLAPVPPPRSVAATSVLKPFIEMSIVKRLTEHSPVQQYKYYKALVQEFHIKVDIGFLNAILAFFEAEEVSDADEAKNFSNDMKVVEEPLMSHVALQSSAEQKNFYDLLHFSPLKIHVSFSLGDGASSQNMPRVLSVLMQSLGVTLTDMNDVVFKLAYLERQYVFLTQAQLQSEATMHYTGQLLKQLYVLVLGLDVIGNPFGLVVGLTKGVEDLFYEPFQGAIQGPGEFAEGLILGVRSLFGHTVGGAAGAASRITGTIGKGLAALTFDKDYIRKRRENLNKRPANLQTGLAQSGKGLVMGVVDGFTGVFTKPISGAKEDGVEGFFKGVGKGVAGLLTRPTAGIVDFASGSLSAVKRATEMTDEVVRLRPPRYFQPDGLVRPYIRHEAEGNKILQELEKGRYNTTDAYIYHVAMTRGGRELLLLTDKRVIYLKTNDIFGGWQVDWTFTWASVTEPPKGMPNGIHISAGEPKKKTFGLFGSSESGKFILIPDEDQRQWLLAKMQELHRKNT